MINLKNSVRRSRHYLRSVLGKDLRVPVELNCTRLLLGNERAEWCVCPDPLSSDSVIYSFGVGEDISFDLALIQRFGLQVHAFDPTPKSIAWLKQQRLPRGFVFHDYGVADYDGVARFYPPENPQYVSYSARQIERGARGVTEAPVWRLGTIMRMLGHQHIDLLKMDIEGSEYGVVNDLAASRLPMKQLLVEFHHRWPGIGIEETRSAMQALHRSGFRIFAVSPSGEEFSFIRT